MKCFWQGSLWLKGVSVVEMWSLLCITFLVQLSFGEIFKNVQISSFAWNSYVKEAKISETNIECASQCINSVDVSEIQYQRMEIGGILGEILRKNESKALNLVHGVKVKCN